MSKSRGNVICPFDACSKLGANEFGVEALRYFLLRHGMLTEDGSNNIQYSAYNSSEAFYSKLHNSFLASSAHCLRC